MPDWGASATTRPQAGTLCVDCGCCYADIYAGNAPICWECDAGAPCKAKRRAPASALPAREERPAVTPPIQPQPEAQTKEIEMARMNSSRPRGKRLNEEQRREILAAPLTVSNCELARRMGISDSGVAYVRKKAGIRSACPGGYSRPAKPAPTESTALTAPKPRAIAAPEKPASDETATIRVEVQIDRRRAQTLFGEFDLNDQAHAIAAVIRKHIEAV